MWKQGRHGITAGLLLGALASCQSDRLVFTTSTRLGIDISASNGSPTGLMLGYKRFEGALVPVDPDKGDASQIGSVLSALDFENGWFQGLKLFQVFATGEAAEKAAADPSHLRDLMKAWFDEQTLKNADGGNVPAPVEHPAAAAKPAPGN